MIKPKVCIGTNREWVIDEPNSKTSMALLKLRSVLLMKTHTHTHLQLNKKQ